MGGLYGHLSHIHEDNSLTFGEVKMIFSSISNNSFSFNEKVDGQAISVSYRNKTLFARNKGHVVDWAKSALSLEEIIEKFEGRGDLSDAFSLAAQDIDKAIESLDDEIKHCVFGNGKKFLNFEIIYPLSRNVIDYERNLIMPHGVIEYKKDGTPKKEHEHLGKLFYNSLGNKQYNTFKIIPPNVLRSTQNGSVNNILTKFMTNHQLKDSHTIDHYIKCKWVEILKEMKGSKDIDKKIKDLILNRLAYDDKSFSLRDLKKAVSDKFYQEFVDLEKNSVKSLRKEILFPLETTFLACGCEILDNIEGFIAPESSKDKIIYEIENTLMILSEWGDTNSNYEVKRFYAIGGFDSVHRSEGIVFNYNKKSYKITGSFAVVNQLLGTIKYGRYATQHQVS